MPQRTKRSKVRRKKNNEVQKKLKISNCKACAQTSAPYDTDDGLCEVQCPDICSKG